MITCQGDTALHAARSTVYPEIGAIVVHNGIKATVVGYHNGNLILEAKGERWIADVRSVEVVSQSSIKNVQETEG